MATKRSEKDLFSTTITDTEDAFEQTNNATDTLTNNLERLGGQLNTATNNVSKFGENVNTANNSLNKLGESADKVAETNQRASRLSQSQAKQNAIESSSGISGGIATSQLAKEIKRLQSSDEGMSRFQTRSGINTDELKISTDTNRRTYTSPNQQYTTSTGTRPHLFGKVGENISGDLNKNMLQAGHMLSPMSFATYAMMFGVSFPMQMKMAETITRPVTSVNEKYEIGKQFATGITGIADAVGGFTSQLHQSPFQMYEGLYQSKILLSSALGGERQSNQAITTALKMAREYPVKTEQVLSSLSRLAVYPQVKPHLQDENFQKKLMESVSGLSLIVPEQGMEGAMFSLVEAMSGS